MGKLIKISLAMAIIFSMSVSTAYGDEYLSGLNSNKMVLDTLTELVNADSFSVDFYYGTEYFATDGAEDFGIDQSFSFTIHVMDGDIDMEMREDSYWRPSYNRSIITQDKIYWYYDDLWLVSDRENTGPGVSDVLGELLTAALDYYDPEELSQGNLGENQEYLTHKLVARDGSYYHKLSFHVDKYFNNWKIYDTYDFHLMMNDFLTGRSMGYLSVMAEVYDMAYTVDDIEFWYYLDLYINAQTGALEKITISLGDIIALHTADGILDIADDIFYQTEIYGFNEDKNIQYPVDAIEVDSMGLDFLGQYLMLLKPAI